MYVTLQRVLELQEQCCLGFVLSPVWEFCSPSFILAMDHKEVCLIAINTVYFNDSQYWQEQSPFGVLLNTADM